jgi:NitT/TauT family transport system permease protein
MDTSAALGRAPAVPAAPSLRVPWVQNPALMKVVWPLLVAVFLLVMWQVWVTVAQVPAFLVPSPWLIAQTLVKDWSLLMGALGVTLRITLLAFVLSAVLGTLIAFLFVQSRWIETAFFPYAVLLQVTPIVAIAPLIII